MSNSIKKLSEAYNSIYTSEQITESSDLTALERSAFTAGGGEEARLKRGQTIAQVIAQGQKNLSKPGTPAAAQTSPPPAPVLPPPTQTTQTTQTPTKPSATPATPTKPAIEKSPQGYAVGTTAGGTKFERRAATGEELRAAQAARKSALALGKSKPDAEEAAVKAGVERGQPTTGPKVDPATAQSDVKKSMDSFTARNLTTNPLKPTGEPSALSKSGGVGAVGTAPAKPLGTKVPVIPVTKESRNSIHGYLMREGYTK